MTVGFLACDGKLVAVPYAARSFLDHDNPLPRATKVNKRSGSPPHGVVWHSVHGTGDGGVAPAAACMDRGAKDAMAYVRAWSSTRGRVASAHIVIADDGTVCCVADLVRDICWHAINHNAWTVGIELDQWGSAGLGDICGPTLDAAVDLAWTLCDLLGIQPMIPGRGGKPYLGDVRRLIEKRANAGFRGHFAHANTPDRGQGDPGPALFDALVRSGFEVFDLDANEDRAAWQGRQKELGVMVQDGVPGPRTIERMQKQLGRSTWAQRKS